MAIRPLARFLASLETTLSREGRGKEKEGNPSRFHWVEIGQHLIPHFTRRSAGRSPSSDALTWARARARRDITVPIGTPCTSATSR